MFSTLKSHSTEVCCFPFRAGIYWFDENSVGTCSLSAARSSWRTSETAHLKACLYSIRKGLQENYQGKSLKKLKGKVSSSREEHHIYTINYDLNCTSWTSLVAQWLRIRLPVQGTRVRALVREDPTCRGASKPVCHNNWPHVPQLVKPACLEPVLRNKRSHRNEKPTHRNEE